MTEAAGNVPPQLEPDGVFEICIIGGGIAGLNALVVATDYLASADRVLLVDRRRQVGGMWNDTYDYVRLHQPHPVFTAGNIRWTGQSDPSHLARKPEVLAHLRHCLDQARQKVALEQRLGWDYVAHEEHADVVEVSLRSPEGDLRMVRTKRLVKAFGHLVQPNPPLSTTSSHVRSTTPEALDVMGEELRSDSAPVWVIGSGKTAMDTVLQLITAFPGREVNMAAGPGTFFGRRDTFFPAGARRWWSGTPLNTMLKQAARRYDGTNEKDVEAWFRATYGIGPTAVAGNFFGAYQSDAECAAIKAGLRSVEPDYFTDAVDRDGGTELVFRSGRTRAVQPGTWLVNCTGALLRTPPPYEPFVSPGGRVVSIQMRSSATGVVSTFAGYYLTHLMFRDELRGAGLYELDLVDLSAKAKPVTFYVATSIAMHNLGVISEILPNKVLMGCGLDYDRWYPLPRRMIGVVDFLRTQRRDREHHRKTLATVRDRYDIRCGPLPG